MTPFQEGYRDTLKTAGIVDKPAIRQSIDRSYASPLVQHPWVKRPWDAIVEMMRMQAAEAEGAI